MARPRTVPDTQVFATIRRLLAEGGDKAVSFGAVGIATGLAPPTLVQRYGSRDAMLRAALADLWDKLDCAITKADAEAAPGPKGAQMLLKTLSGLANEAGDEAAPGAWDIGLLSGDFRDPDLRARAKVWRRQVEAALARRLGGGEEGQTSAALLFAVWQGGLLWQPAGGKGFRLRDALRRFTG